MSVLSLRPLLGRVQLVNGLITLKSTLLLVLTCMKRKRTERKKQPRFVFSLFCSLAYLHASQLFDVFAVPTFAAALQGIRSLTRLLAHEEEVILVGRRSWSLSEEQSRVLRLRRSSPDDVSCRRLIGGQQERERCLSVRASSQMQLQLLSHSSAPRAAAGRASVRVCQRPGLSVNERVCMRSSASSLRRK